MKHKKVKTLLITGIVTALSQGGISYAEKSESELKAQAKITEQQAAAIAVQKVPGGTIKDKEIEEENGKLVWSFDFAVPGTKDITEVQVDAKTGAVVEVKNETPKQQAEEKDEKDKEQAK